MFWKIKYEVVYVKFLNDPFFIRNIVLLPMLKVN
jgi:hypothetical protein